MTTDLRALAGYAYRARRAHAAPRCELCGASLGGAHRHVVEVRSSEVRCACGACAVLFTDLGAGGGRFRTVPDRLLYDPGFRPDEAEWAALSLPVGLAYLTHQSVPDRHVAFYPSPGGAITSPIEREVWTRLAARTPLAALVEPDVEALLVRRHRGGTRPAEAFLASVDRCLELVALVRRTFAGFDGGDEARRAISAFFDDLRAHARPVKGGDP
jgi:hypothetical protein